MPVWVVTISKVDLKGITKYKFDKADGFGSGDGDRITVFSQNTILASFQNDSVVYAGMVDPDSIVEAVVAN